MFEQDNTFGINFTLHIEIFLQMFPSSWSEESDLNYANFDLIDLSQIPRRIIGNQLYCSITILSTKIRWTASEEPIYKNNKIIKPKRVDLSKIIIKIWDEHCPVQRLIKKYSSRKFWRISPYSKTRKFALWACFKEVNAFYISATR